MTNILAKRLMQALPWLCIVYLLSVIHSYESDSSNGRLLQSAPQYSFVRDPSDPRTIMLKVDGQIYQRHDPTAEAAEVETPMAIDIQENEIIPDMIDEPQISEDAPPPGTTIYEQHPPPADSYSNIDLTPQIDDQRRFLAQIHSLQNPPDCQNARILQKDNLSRNYDSNGLCVKINEMGKMLEVGLATHRTLVISPNWRSFYEPENCDESTTIPWNCLWEPVSRCTTIAADDPDDKRPSGLVAGDATISDDSRFFDVRFYGPQRVVWAPQWDFKWNKDGHVDVVPGWERTHGMFWVRAHVAHYLWRPNAALKGEVEARMPGEVTDGRRYIAFHVRLTDNIEHFDGYFGRSGRELKAFGNFMGHADRFRETNADVDTIYIASDSDEVIEASRSEEWSSWKFVFQENVVRSTGDIGYDWFRDGRSEAAAAVCADIEVMRRADFLVGSFHSNVYRLAAELNLAWNIEKYPINQDRFRTVDIEWYEDP